MTGLVLGGMQFQIDVFQNLSEECSEVEYSVEIWT